MLRKSSLIIAMMAMVSAGSVAAAAPLPATGLVRNQVALGVAGRPTPYMRAMAQQCGTTATPASCAATAQSNFVGGGASLFLLLAALAAAGFGFYAGFHKHHHRDNTPISS